MYSVHPEIKRYLRGKMYSQKEKTQDFFSSSAVKKFSRKIEIYKTHLQSYNEAGKRAYYILRSTRQLSKNGPTSIQPWKKAPNQYVTLRNSLHSLG